MNLTIGKKMGDQKMKEIDIEWMRKIDAVHGKLSRSVPIDSKTSRCTKEILIDRYFKFLDNRAFKLTLPSEGMNYRTEEEITYEVFYAWFNKTKHTTCSEDKNRDGEVHYSYGVEKYNGWNDHEFTLTFRDEKLKHRSFKFHWNEIMRIRYERIPLERYWEIVGLFVDMAAPKETPDECEYFDQAQGKRYCTSDDTRFKRCEGVTCGYFKEK